MRHSCGKCGLEPMELHGAAGEDEAGEREVLLMYGRLTRWLDQSGRAIERGRTD